MIILKHILKKWDAGRGLDSYGAYVHDNGTSIFIKVTEYLDMVTTNRNMKRHHINIYRVTLDDAVNSFYIKDIFHRLESHSLF